MTRVLVGRAVRHPRRAVVYGLVDPREPGWIRYVGQTTRPTVRLLDHIGKPNKSGSELAAWLRELSAAGVEPNLITLERCPAKLSKERERYWIVLLRREGMVDLNRIVPSTGAEVGSRIATLRAQGWTWTRIGNDLDISRDQARRRWEKETGCKSYGYIRPTSPTPTHADANDDAAA